jgi:hypothetical protein
MFKLGGKVISSILGVCFSKIEYNILPMCIIVDLLVVFLSLHLVHLIVITSLVTCLPLIFIFRDRQIAKNCDAIILI